MLGVIDRLALVRKLMAFQPILQFIVVDGDEERLLDVPFAWLERGEILEGILGKDFKDLASLLDGLELGCRADGEEWLGIFLVDCLVLGMLLEEGLLLLRKILPEGMECLDLALEVLAVGFKCGVFWLVLRLCRMILDRGLIMRLEPCLILQELLVVACRLAFHRFCDALAVAEGKVPELAVRGLNGGIAERDGKFRFPVVVVVEVFLVGMVGLCEEPIGIFPDKLDVLARGSVFPSLSVNSPAYSE